MLTNKMLDLSRRRSSDLTYLLPCSPRVGMDACAAVLFDFFGVVVIVGVCFGVALEEVSIVDSYGYGSA